MKKHLFKAAFLLAAITFSAQFSFAQTTAAAQKKKLVNDLVAATFASFPIEGLETTIEKMKDSGAKEIEAQMANLINEKLDASANMPAAKKNEIRKKIPAFTALFSERFKTMLGENLDLPLWIKESLAVNFDRQFTLAELRRLSAFFKSPSGKDFTNLVKEIAAAEAEKREPQTDGIVPKKSEVQIERFMKTPLADKFMKKFTEDPDGILEKRIDEWGDKMIEKVEEDMRSGEMNKILMDFVNENFG